ncbi:histidine--tRNA ligase [Candidatus Babeliales bacterium]|nr:histidine--tRNA ligase [Candidatus Babeliales bacterium]
MMISRVRGTEDLLDLKFLNFIIGKVKKHFQLYNFKEIDTPILESTNLFIRSLGEQTDVISKEMYVFKTTSGESICLRPEATTPTMRAFLESGIQSIPWKVFSVGPMFRHERPQKGRWRQFTQINAEIVGTNSISQDAHLIKIHDRFFNEILGLENYVLKINFLGTSDDRKGHREALIKFLNDVENQICETCKIRKEKNILRIFDCKNEQCKNVYKNAPKITDHLSKESDKEWTFLKDLLDILSVSYIHNDTLVRGLDYYDKTVFEFTSKELGAQDAFCSGGRYNTLATQIDSKQDFPSIGAATGLGRLLFLTEKVKDKLAVPQEPVLSIVIPMAEEQQPLALLLAYELEYNNKSVDILLDEGSMKSMMRKANKLGAKYVLVIGEKEQQEGTVSIKNMQTGEDFSIKQSEAHQILK